MKTIYLLIISLTISQFSFAQKAKIDSLFVEFKKQSFYGNIYPAKKKLEDYQKEIIPQLVKLVKDTTFVKLTGTADLIYPGTKIFYGHGHFVPYDMDWISVRAGWLLEELTFEDFGYKTSGVDEDLMLKLIKENHTEYTKTGVYDLEWKNKTPSEKQIEMRKVFSIKVETWWKKNKKNWSRLNAIKEALKSNDEGRILNVLNYLRSGKSKCDNLDQNKYVTEIIPLVEELKKSNSEEINIQVNELFNEYHNWDKKNSW